MKKMFLFLVALVLVQRLQRVVVRRLQIIVRTFQIIIKRKKQVAQVIQKRSLIGLLHLDLVEEMISCPEISLTS
jgi:hypothetical protein